MYEEETPTTDRFIPQILERTDCRKHDAPIGIPCFHVASKVIEGYYAAVCHKRAARAGYNAPIDPRSLSMKKRNRVRS